MARSLSQLAKAAGVWVRDARAHFGWSQEDLIDRICGLDAYFRVVRVPSLEDVQNLEAGRELHLPAWIKFARLAVELEQLNTEEQRLRWAEQRSPWQSHVPHDELDSCWPLVSRPEFHLLEHLDSMPEDERRMAFRLAASWNSPYAERNKVFDATIKALAARMHVPAPKTIPEAAQELTPGLRSLLYKLEPHDVPILKAYLICDDAGRKAIAEAATREINRLFNAPEDEAE